jgi:hypothetical protein
MKPSSRLLVSIALAFAVRPALAAKSSAAPAPGWKMSGQMEESCSCDGACPCWWGNHPTKMTCSGSEALFIDKGSYGGVKLDGLSMAQFVQSPEGKTMMESMGNWNFGYLYIDSKADAKQREALAKIAAQVFPPIAPERMKTRFVPITRTVENGEHRVSFGEYGSFSAHLLPGGMGGTPTISNPPLPEPMHKQWSQGVTTRQTYSDAAKWDFANSNYMFATFDTDSAEYAKFEEMVKKMMSEKK